jgi:hypothetical protein
MSKPFIIIPQSELQKFTRWTNSLAKENQAQCQRAIFATCTNIVRRAMRLAPVNFGFLRASVGTNATGAGMSAEVWAGGSGKGVNVKYAPYVEFGTGNKVYVPQELSEYAIQFKGRGIRKVNTSHQPYFFPSVKISVKEMYAKLHQMGFK